MFGKLIKFEMKNCVRRFAPIWGLIFLLCIIVGIGNAGLDLSGLGMLGRIVDGFLPVLLLFGVCVAACVVAVVYVCERYYKGLLGQEGYLMHTLPVSEAELIGSKLICAVLMEIISAAVGFLGAFITLVIIGGFPQVSGAELHAVMESMGEHFPGWGWLAAEGIVAVLLIAAEADLRIYAAISVGHLAKKNRGLWSFLAFLGICIAVSLLSRLFGVRVLRIDTLQTLFSGDFQEMANGFVRLSAAVTGAAIARMAVLCAAFFALCLGILSKKLNLE